MSAYVVDDVTINVILAGIRSCEHPSATGTYTEWHSVRLPVWLRSAPANTYEALGHQLRQMNEEAVRYRYPDDAPDAIPGPRGEDGRLPAYTYHTEANGSALRVLKAVNCYLYQCCEGNTPKEGLYKALDKWADRLGRAIVCHSAAYEALPWE